jgi:hypothetical protein
MSARRLVAVLALLCVIDLATPVTPAPVGIEFDDDGELVLVGSLDDGRRPEGASVHPEGHRELRPAVWLTVPRLSASRIPALVHPRAPRVVLAGDRAAPPDRSPEDH